MEQILVRDQDDEIVISLVGQRMVVHDTVRITVNVNAQRDQNTNEIQLRADIKSALRKFINTDWRFIRVDRQRGHSRFESVIVQAIARVPEHENVQLADRADAASTPEIQVINPQANYTLPFDKIQEVNRELRAMLVKQAHSECRLHSKASGVNYRVGEILFADTPKAQSQGGAEAMRGGRAYATNTMAQTVASNVYAVGSVQHAVAVDEADEGTPDLGVTERFWVAAQVTLRAAKE